MSDAINLTSRIEGLNKMYGTSILTSNLTLEAIKDLSPFTYRMVDRVVVKGRVGSIDLYEFFPVEQQKGLIESYTKAYKLYEQGEFAKAIDILKNYPEDVPSQILKDRCHQFAHEGVPADWKGIYKMHDK